MKETIIKYAERASKIPNWWSSSEVGDFNEQLKKLYIDKRIYFIPRNTKTDFSKFENELGYQMPFDIREYINLFWHPYIKGFYKIDECIILFSVIKYDNESCDDVLYHENGIIKLADEWRSVFGGNTQKFLPIGWLDYTGRYLLYEINTGKIYTEKFDCEGMPSDQPLADSLKELIENLNVCKKKGGI